MGRRKWLSAALLGAAALVTSGLVYAGVQRATSGGYTCPLTGEQLPCSNCCPLNKATADDKKDAASDEGYTCPLTGEKLKCPGCCPLNQDK